MRCLLVEDDKDSRDILKYHMSKYGRCDEVANGLLAVEAFRIALEEADPYDLICLDIMMPGTTGHEVLSEVRQMENNAGISRDSGVKIMMVSALNDIGNMLKSQQLGCDTYITKPIDKNSIENAMTKMDLVHS